MKGHVQKWGNSLGVRLPMQFAKELDLRDGSVVFITSEAGRIVIQPPKYTLDALLEKITPKKRHRQQFEDSPRGNEEW